MRRVLYYVSQNTKRQFTALLTFKQQRKSETYSFPPLTVTSHIGDGSEGDQGTCPSFSDGWHKGVQRTILIMHTGATRGQAFQTLVLGSCRPYDCIPTWCPLPKIYCFLHQCIRTYSLYHLLRAVLLRMGIFFYIVISHRLIAHSPWGIKFTSLAQI